ncbi:hypothetical protein BLOT_003073 [Blomia tropicalis]|nr:hypothetical protein BLOT_003073 [Blomia tropicalis]
MAHKMLNKSNNNNTTLSSGKKDLPSSKLDSEKVHAAWSLWPLLSNSLKRSESANDLTSLPRSTFLTIPDDSNHGNDRTQSNGRGKRSPSPFRKHSINELVSKSNESKNSEFLTPTLVSTTRRSSTSHTPPNRRSDEATNSSSSTINEIDCQKTSFISPPKEMIQNPLYYTKGQLQSTDQCETESSSLLNTQTRSSPVGSNHSQQKYSQSDSVRAEPATIQFDSISSSSSSMSSNDKPPPLPPKTYQSRSGSSTRSSIASNTSSNSYMIITVNLDTLVIITHTRWRIISLVGIWVNTCPHIPPPQPGNQCGCRSPPKTSSPVDLSQVTLRPKKNRGRVSSSDNDGSNSPPPLPPPDSFLFAMDDGSKSSKSNPLLYQWHNDHIVQPICFYCHHHSRTSHRSPPPPPPPQIRTYRRRDGDGEHKTQSMTMTKAMRSYSIADSSTLKSSMAQLSYR